MGPADGRSHWNVSVLQGMSRPGPRCQPGPALTDGDRRDGGPGALQLQLLLLLLHVATGRRSDHAAETDGSARPRSANGKQTLIKPLCTDGVC